MIVRAVRVRSFSLFLVQLDWCRLWIYIFLRMQLCSELLRVNEHTLSQAHNPGEELFTTYGARHIQSSIQKVPAGWALVCCKRSNMLLYRTYGQGLAGQADSRPN